MQGLLVVPDDDDDEDDGNVYDNDINGAGSLGSPCKKFLTVMTMMMTTYMMIKIMT